jgi:hypothetical protein
MTDRCKDCVAMKILDDFVRRLNREECTVVAEALEAAIRTGTEPTPAPTTKDQQRKRDTCYNTCAAVGCKTRIAYHPGDKPGKYCEKHQEQVDERVRKARVG